MRDNLLLESCCLLLVPTVLLICLLCHIEQTALLGFLAACGALIPFFVSFERRRPRPRDLMPVVILSALGVAARAIFAPFPNIQPSTALIVLCGAYFGRNSGLLAGALCALCSNLLLGQGPWTPWQMYAWGLCGYLAGVVFWRRNKKSKRAIAGLVLFGGAVALLYGLILDAYFLLGFVRPLTMPSAFAALLAGAPFNLAHAASTLVFLAATAVPYGNILQRIRQKYGIMSREEPLDM